MESNGGWRKSTFSGQQGSCVEVGRDDAILARDTTDREGGTLAFSAGAWQEFLLTLR